MFGGKTQKEPDSEFFTIYDSKTKNYREPALATNRFDLIRQFQNMMLDPQQAKNPYLINAEDYSIFKVGEFDRRTGAIKSTPHEHIVNLHDLRAVAQQKQANVTDINSAHPGQGH